MFSGDLQIIGTLKSNDFNLYLFIIKLLTCGSKACSNPECKIQRSLCKDLTQSLMMIESQHPKNLLEELDFLQSFLKSPCHGAK